MKRKRRPSPAERAAVAKWINEHVGRLEVHVLEDGPWLCVVRLDGAVERITPVGEP